jgi:hypothetical protein
MPTTEVFSILIAFFFPSFPSLSCNVDQGNRVAVIHAIADGSAQNIGKEKGYSFP